MNLSLAPKLVILADKIEDHYYVDSKKESPLEFVHIGKTAQEDILALHSPGEGDWVYIRHPIWGDVRVEFPPPAAITKQ